MTSDGDPGSEPSAEAFARSLVRAAREELPAEAARRRVFEIVTSGGALVGASSLTSATSAASKPAVLGLPAGALKWGAAGLAACALAAGGAGYAQRSPDPDPAPLRAGIVRPSAGVATLARAPAPPLAAPVPSIPPERVRRAAAKPRVDELAAEAALLREARRDIDAGRAGPALAVLDRHRATWPRGHLGLEAAVLRVEALALAGQRGAARAQAREFLRRHPDTPFSRRVRRHAELPDAP